MPTAGSNLGRNDANGGYGTYDACKYNDAHELHDAADDATGL